MLNQKIMIPLVVVGLGILIFGSYKAAAYANNNAKITPSVDLIEQEKVQPIKALDTTSVAAEMKTEAPAQPAAAPPIDNKLKELITKGDVIEAKEGYTYAQGKIVVIDKKIFVGLEGYRVAVDQSSYYTGNYYVIVDFSILNLGNTNYVSSTSNFELKDSNYYTYDPVLTINTRGDISGDLKFRDSRRGEIAFYVPGSETRFELSFSTGIDAVKTIRFNFDTNSLINPALPNQQAPY